MSTDRDLDLDAILAEFHNAERQGDREKAPAARRSAPRREDSAILNALPSTEETQLYTERAPRHAAPEPPHVPAPAPAPAPAPREPEAPVRQPKPAEPRRSAARQPEQTAPNPSAARQRPKKKARRGMGFALLFALLLVTAAILAFLVQWVVRTENERQAPEPVVVRMELGAELESYLDESAGSNR